MNTTRKIISATLWLALAATAWGDGWAVETITPKECGKGCCIEVDNKGNPHVTFLDQSHRYDWVTYATRENEEWRYETVAFDIASSDSTAVTLDAYDRPYVLYHDQEEEKLIYAYKDVGQNWVKGTVDTGGVLGNYMSFGQCPTGYVYASYDEFVSSYTVRLKYASKEGSSWAAENITTSGVKGAFNTLVVDSQKVPHVIYLDSNERAVTHAVLENDAWEFEKIAEGTDCDAYLTPDGNIHVSFVKNDNSALLHAVYDGNDWTTEEVANVKGTPAYTQICVTPTGDVFISYYNFDTLRLHVMKKTGTTWTHRRITNSNFTGLPHVMAIGNDDYPQIVFYDAKTKVLRWAGYDPTLWVGPNPADRRRAEPKPAAFALFQNAPNPASGTTTFSFELAEAADVTLAVYDAAGRKVATVAEGYFPAGAHNVPFAKKLAPGVYVYRLEAGAKSAARKMVVAR
jgi:hypothetical protein